MIHERVYLNPEDHRIYIDTYIADDRHYARPAMLVLPGGAYKNVCASREGEPIALAYFAKGFNAFVLNYGTDTECDVYPKHLVDAARAILHIRKNAVQYSIDKNKVYAVGFSAGGHLAGSLAIFSGREEVLSALKVSVADIRPNAVVLSYPVVSACSNSHKGSFENLTRKPFDALSEEERDYYSLEKHVDESSSPAFIWHTATDAGVPAENSLALAAAYVRAKVALSLRIYPYGPHGLALSNEITDTNGGAIEPIAEEWVDKSIEFLKSLK